MAEHLAATIPVENHGNGIAPEGRDSRAQDIYGAERDSLSFRQSLRLLIKGWGFFAHHRRLVVLKSAIAISSMLLFLITPWPMKIIIDNVIDGHPLEGMPRRILLPLVGTDRVALLTADCLFLLVTVILTGISGDDPQPVDTDIGSGGLDQAGASGGAANNGWSLWNGILGLLETYVTLDLSQRVNQDLRTAIYQRFLRSPLGLYGDQKIGDAVFRVMNDSAAISEVFYRGLLAPAMSITMFVCALVVVTATILQRADDPDRLRAPAPAHWDRRSRVQPGLSRSRADHARAGQQRDGGVRGAPRQCPSDQGLRNGRPRNQHCGHRELGILRGHAQVRRLLPRDGADPDAANSLPRDRRSLSSI